MRSGKFKWNMCDNRRKENSWFKKMIASDQIWSCYSNVEFSCHIIASFEHKMADKNYSTHQP